MCEGWKSNQTNKQHYVMQKQLLSLSHKQIGQSRDWQHREHHHSLSNRHLGRQNSPLSVTVLCTPLLSMKSYGVKYPFGGLGPAVLAALLPASCPACSLGLDLRKRSLSDAEQALGHQPVCHQPCSSLNSKHRIFLKYFPRTMTSLRQLRWLFLWWLTFPCFMWGKMYAIVCHVDTMMVYGELLCFSCPFQPLIF